MTRELEPCPFCPDGGNPNHFGGAGHHCVKCSKCGRTNEKLIWTESDGWHYEAFDSVQEAYDDWNTRHKRTCHPVENYNDDSPWPVMVCSECGRPLHYDETNDDYEYAPYCCCGAEVVDGD